MGQEEKKIITILKTEVDDKTLNVEDVVDRSNLEYKSQGENIIANANTNPFAITNVKKQSFIPTQNGNQVTRSNKEQDNVEKENN
jgi:hypothetical protein